MNKKIYSTPTTSIVRGSELMQDTPPVNFGSGTLNGDNEGEVLGKENADDVVEDDDDGFPAMHDAFQTRKAWKD